MFVLIAMVLVGFLIGLVLASFLMIAGWFAWTPLPLILRVPLGLLLVAPFGLLASGLGTLSSLTVPIFFVLWVGLFMAFFADRSASYAFCLTMVFLFGVFPIVVQAIMNPESVASLQSGTFGITVVLMLTFAALCSPVRWLGYRLERLSVDASDQTMRLMTERTLDQWMTHFQNEATSTNDLAQISFADAMRTMRERGVPEHSAKIAVKSLFRAIGNPAPRLATGRLDGGLVSWIQWATTGPSRRAIARGFTG